MQNWRGKNGRKGEGELNCFWCGQERIYRRVVHPTGRGGPKTRGRETNDGVGMFFERMKARKTGDCTHNRKRSKV